MNDRFRFIRDVGLKYIGNSRKQRYMFSLFECPYCHNIIETRKTIGMKQVCCKKCYKDYRKGKKIGNIVDKVVHHINENKLDNTPENLLVLTQSEHIRLHANKRKRGKNGRFKI